MSARVLVVDDLETNLKVLEAKLAAEYFDVLTANSGAKALELVATELPDIVLLDVMMPEMDGFEVCKRLKSDPKTAHIPVVMVTNQAGIAHGHYGWAEFIQVQEKILDDLAAEGAFVNGVFACPHHDGGRAPYDVENHPWRKPNTGMLLAAAERLPLDLGQSWIIGDRAGDLESGKNAALAGGLHVLSGHGADGGERDSALALAGSRFQTLVAPTIAGAIFQLPLFQSVVDGAS